MALFSAKRVFAFARDAAGPAFSERERRWLWLTELPFLACAVARDLGRARSAAAPAHLRRAGRRLRVASNVRIVLPDGGHAPSTQLVFVPMLLLAPLNLVPLLVLARQPPRGGVYYTSASAGRWRAAVLALGNSA